MNNQVGDGTSNESTCFMCSETFTDSLLQTFQGENLENLSIYKIELNKFIDNLVYSSQKNSILSIVVQTNTTLSDE